MMQICTEPNKRKLIPRWDDYSCFTKFENGEYILKNGAGDTIYKFKDEEDRNAKAQAMVDVLMSMYWAKRNSFMEHKERHPEYYAKTYEEANWVHRAIYKGFTPNIKDLNPYENWFGVALYNPELILTKDRKKIIISLQSFSVPYNNKYEELFDNRAIRYLELKNGSDSLYKNWTGQLPANDFIENFIS